MKKTQKELIIESLREYVFPIFNDNNQLEGYSVDGLADVLDVNVPKVVFTDFTNKYNLEHACVHVLSLSAYYIYIYIYIA